MTKDTTYTWVTAPMYVCCSPEMGHVVVWCTEYVCRLTSSYRHTAAHTAIGVCVCALHAWGKNVCIPICISLTVYLSLPQGAGDNRAEWGQIRTGVLWSGTAHLVMPAWEDSCGSLVLQPLILHLVRGEKKRIWRILFLPHPRKHHRKKTKAEQLWVTYTLELSCIT